MAAENRCDNCQEVIPAGQSHLTHAPSALAYCSAECMNAKVIDPVVVTRIDEAEKLYKAAFVLVADTIRTWMADRHEDGVDADMSLKAITAVLAFQVGAHGDMCEFFGVEDVQKFVDQQIAEGKKSHQDFLIFTGRKKS